MNCIISKEIYFLVTTNNKHQFAFSSILFQTKDDDSIKLQAFTDLHWSFKLPKKPIIHQLYKYKLIGKTNSDPKINIFKKFLSGDMHNFELICDFCIDPDQQPFLSFKNQYLQMSQDPKCLADREGFFNDYILTLNVENEKYDVTIDYDGHIYNDCKKIRTFISHPFISIIRK